jgi:hypothetical protein
MFTGALPHGTEVTTRVERVVGERRVPQGAVGRVVGTHDALYDVQLVGGGVASYARDELLPRKGGQLRYAARRQAAWDALAPCIVIETVVGSRAWGLADEGSDTDKRGAFVLPLAWTTGIAAPAEELVSSDGSATYWEAGKLVRQALRADPNTLETLFVDGATARDELGQWILDARDVFPSVSIYGSFARYALSQLKKLRQSLRLAEHRGLVLGWLREPSPPTLDELALRLARDAHVEAPSAADAQLLAKQYIKQLYHSLYDQALIAHADLPSLVSYARQGGGEPELPRELRPKNAYNLVRLLATALGWLRTGAPSFRIEEPLRTRLLAIKRGEIPLAAVLDHAEALAPELEDARQTTPLPARPDLARADALMRRVRGEAARRSVERVPGPWGDAAPAPPPVEWEEDA